MIRRIDAPTAKSLVHGTGEIAFLDVREHGQDGEGHPLFAVPCPYSRLELLAPRLMPNAAVPVLLLDDGDGVAVRAARRLEALGYADLAVLEGGAQAWARAGYTLFKGVNVPSKALGELVEEAWHPRTVDARTLAAWRKEGRRFRLFDARPPEEYRKMRVPGARCLPNGELLHRFQSVVDDPGMPVVVTCAGRTRGYIGAVGLHLAGIANPVYVLENGTQGWALAGFELERGNEPDPLPPLTTEAARASRVGAERIAERWPVPWLDGAGLRALIADRSRTLYAIDVRTPEEFASGHLPGSAQAFGGQLVQATDQWIGVRRARVVLIDDTGLRATLAAYWLRQLGFEVHVLPEIGAQPGDRMPEPARPVWSGSELPTVTPTESAAMLARKEAVLLDLRPSMAHRRGHPQGARWAIRPRLVGTLGDRRRPVHLLSDEPEVAALAAVDLAELGVAEVRLVEGGMTAWQAAGLAVETTPDRPPDADAIDFLFFVHDRHDGNLEASRRYLAWETELVRLLDDQERAEFRLAR